MRTKFWYSIMAGSSSAAHTTNCWRSVENMRGYASKVCSKLPHCGKGNRRQKLPLRRQPRQKKNCQSADIEASAGPIGAPTDEAAFQRDCAKNRSLLRAGPTTRLFRAGVYLAECNLVRHIRLRQASAWQANHSSIFRHAE